jgi:hypothetical protein
MLVISAYIPSGVTSRVHHHSGLEVFYAVDGEYCLETRASLPDAKGRDARGSNWRNDASRGQLNEAAKGVCGDRL